MKSIFLQTICLGFVFMTNIVQGQEKASVSPAIFQTPNESTYRKTLEFLIAECLVKRTKTAFPGTVIGEIQYGFDRISSGWLIYLYSSGDSKRTVNVEINLDMKKVRLVVAVRDLLNNEAFRGYSFRIPVHTGQYRVLIIQTEPFEPDYEDYFE